MQRAIRHIRKSLEGLYPPEEIDSFIRIIFEKTCHFSAADFILHKNTILSPTRQQEIDTIVQRLQKCEPLQYITGETWFCGLRFRTAPGALIPRPETEELADLIIRRHRGTSGRLADIGTGTGCIAITLACYLPGFEAEGWDISPEALAVAADNATALQTSVAFRQADILSYRPTPGEYGKYDIWVSNPPYVRESEKKEMRPNVLDYEPHTALFVPDDDPLLFYRRIAQTALHTLKPGGFLYFEINAALGGETQALLADIGYRQIELIRDIQQRDRFVIARHP